MHVQGDEQLNRESTQIPAQQQPKEFEEIDPIKGLGGVQQNNMG